jgi:threonine dehydrogenase-like Zn-dependent dehydrogenase
MRELTFLQPGVLRWREAPQPRVRGPGEAVVAPVAATTCDLDRSIIKGRAPFAGPIALGHEFVAVVVDAADDVERFAAGDVVAVSAQISCGRCDRCRAGGTAFCRAVAPNSMYGLGPSAGDWGGGFSDFVRVPYADAMLARMPRGVDPVRVAAAGDNLTNAFEAVVPHLRRTPGARVLIAGVASTGLYAVQLARAASAGAVDYLDHDARRLELAARLGARPIELSRGRAKPLLAREYDIAVDARGDAEDLVLLLRSLVPRGICTSVSMYFRDSPLPLLEMMLHGVRLELTPTNVGAHLQDVLDLVGHGDIAPDEVTTDVLGWEELPRALADPSMKPVFVRDMAHSPARSNGSKA